MLPALLLACTSTGPGDSATDPRDSGYSALALSTEAARVERDGADFLRQGEPFRFFGFNTRGILHYGDSAVLPASSAEDAAFTLDTVEDLGGTVIRVYVSHQSVDPTTAAERLAALLDEAERRHLYVIAVLTDAVDSGFCPPGDEDAYSDGSPPTLDGVWYDGGWEDHYLPALQAAVQRNAGRPGLLAWELANEPGLAPDPTPFLGWVEAAAAEVRALDADTMVTAGVLSTGGAGLSAAQGAEMYAHLDFATLHSYDETVISDLSVLLELDVPIVGEAVGYSGNERAAVVAYGAGKLIGAGAEGFMQAGFMATEDDIGDGDALIGMDRVFHTDWETLYTTYQGLVSRL